MHPLEDIWHELEHKFDTVCAGTRTEVIDKLHQLLRRFRQYRNETDWIQLVLEGASHFAKQVALFSIEGGNARLRGKVNLELADGLSFPLSQAGAFEAVRASRDATIALKTAAEVTEIISVAVAGERVRLFPITNASRVAAILFVADAEAETNAHGLEIIAGLASYALERQSSAPANSQIGTAPTASRQAAKLPAWASFGEPERQLHLRARRFARVAVAEMQLAKPEACRAGREQGDLYLFLKSEIDKAREIYSKQFRTISSMEDYLHLELVSRAAEGDELKLGADYPGQLV